MAAYCIHSKSTATVRVETYEALSPAFDFDAFHLAKAPRKSRSQITILSTAALNRGRRTLSVPTRVQYAYNSTRSLPRAGFVLPLGPIND